MRIHTVIVGGGQAGLATSRCLRDRAVDHIVLERGRVAERWRSERWDSLRLLTPNWQTRLPGFQYRGPDPDGYMGMPEVIAFLEGYAESCSAPLETGTSVRRVARAGGRYHVDTVRGTWLADNVVVATGYSDLPLVPAAARRLDPGIVQLTPARYRNPRQLPDGGVLVVGASASGVQLADELHASGRPVTMAVGRHLRLPRRYRGRDILWWLDEMKVLDEPAGDVFDIEASRRQPSLQLVGRPDHASLDLAMLQRKGVRLAGRLLDADAGTVFLDDDLIASTVASDAKLASLLARIEAFVARNGLAATADAAEAFEPLWPAVAPGPTLLNLHRERIRTVLWCTGFRRSYPWLAVPVLDGRGEIRQRGGVTPAPGLYTVGLHFQRRRNSAFIDGVGADAHAVAEHIVRRARTGAAAPLERKASRDASRHQAVV